MKGASALFIRLFLGFALVLAAVGKLRNEGREFKLLLRNLAPIETESLIQGLAWGLPRLELILGTLLILGISLRATSIAATGLLALFCAWMGWIVLSGIDLPSCGCFAIRLLDEGPPILWLIRNIGFTALALSLALGRSDLFSVDRCLASRRKTT